GQLPLQVAETAKAAPGVKASSFAAIQNQEDAPPCSTCGSIMVRSGACYRCSNGGTTSAWHSLPALSDPSAGSGSASASSRAERRSRESKGYKCSNCGTTSGYA